MIRIFVGYDPKEAIAYHNFCESVIKHCTEPVSFTPLALNTLQDYKENHKDGSNEFIYSRFLVPHLCGYKGKALFVDGDMLCKADISELFYKPMFDAVSVVKHNYKTKYPIKYLGNINEDYPRKNWSSVMLFNCSHKDCSKLTPEYVAKAKGKHLHRFEWADDVGELPIEWNWLANEYDYNPDAKLIHYTIGTPCFKGYHDMDYGKEWMTTFTHTINPLTGIFRSKL